MRSIQMSISLPMEKILSIQSMAMFMKDSLQTVPLRMLSKFIDMCSATRPAVFQAPAYYRHLQFVKNLVLWNSLTHSPPQPPIGRFCFESLIPRTANWQARLSSSGSPEQLFGGLTLLAVFELTVTLLVKIIKYDDRLVFVLLIYAKKRNGHSEKF